MALYLINHEKQLVQFQNDPASILSYPSFPGGNVLSFRNANANLLIKEILSDLFCLRYKVFRFSNKQSLESVSHAPGIHSRVMLQNEIHLSIDSVGEMHQKEGTVSLLCGEVGRCHTTLDAGIEYRALDIYAGKNLASQLAEFFPEARFDSGRVQNLSPYPCFISPALHNIIDAILNCPYDEATSRFYLEVKVREYFFLLLKEYSGFKETKYRFTPFEIERLVEARELLLKDLEKPPMTIRKLAREAGISESKLKAGFSHYFKTDVFECFQRARMYKAKQMVLHTNKPLKDICTFAGYARMTNFITGFRRFFGKTPGSLRR